jgi:mannosyl-3-phosphoglycerate phosphatase
MLRPRPLIVFSEVDGVFDQATAHSFDVAARKVAWLTRNHVPLVLCSSKTRAELEHISQGLGISHPFICESGSAVFIPKGYLGFSVRDGRELAGYKALEFGRSYTEIVEILRTTADRQRIRIRGFSDMSVEEVAREGGVSLLEARLAKLREYGEFFRVLDPDPAARRRLFTALRSARVLCTTIGPLYDHAGAAVDHRLGVSLLRGLYRRACGDVVSVGVAQPRHEGNLLQLVDIPVAVRARNMSIDAHVTEESSAAAVIEIDGVEAWVDTIVELVQESRRPCRVSVD